MSNEETKDTNPDPSGVFPTGVVPVIVSFESAKDGETKTSHETQSEPKIKGKAKEKIKKFFHDWNDVLNITIQFVLAGLTFALFVIAIMASWDTKAAIAEAKRANDLSEKYFKLSNSAKLFLSNTFIWRNAYYQNPSFKPRRVSFQFNLQNGSEHLAQINYFKYKIFFKPDILIIKKGFSGDILLDSIDIASTQINESQTNLLNNKPGIYTKLIIDTVLTEQDSANLEKNLSIVFLEIHYLNIITNDSLKFQFIGQLNGENPKDPTPGPLYGRPLDIQRNWIRNYFEKEIPDK